MPNNKKLAQQRAMVKALSSQKKREAESKAKGKQASTYALPSENKPFTLLEKAAIRRSQQNRPQGSSVNYDAEFDNIQKQMKDLRLKQLGSFVTGLRANPLMTYQTNTDEINAYADEISRLKQRSAVLKANEQADIVRNAQQKYRDSGSKVNTTKLNRSFVDRGIEGSPLEAKGNRFFEGEPLEWLADLDASDFKDPDLYIDALRTTQLIGKGDHGQTLATAIATSLQPEYERYMSDEEIGTYNYLWENESRKAAREYLNSLKTELNARRTEQSNAKWSEYAGRNAGTAAAASAASVPLNLLGGPASTGEMLKQNAIGALTGKYGVDYNQTGGMMAQNAEAIRGAVTQKYNWNLGNWDAFDTLYGSGMSLLDSLAASAVGGNAGKASEVIGGLVLGSSAASGAARDIVSRGGTDDQALAGAVAAGAFETLFEKVSIGNFKALQEVAPNTFKDVAKNVLKSVGVNASEEAATELANIIYDTVALGDISNWELSVQNYMKQGLSEEQAKAQTAHDMALQIGEAGLSGALIGGGMAGAGSAIGWLNNRQAANVEVSEPEAAALNTLADISERQTTGTSTIADTVAEKVLTGQAPTNSEIRQLYAASGPVRAQFAELTGIDIVGMDQTRLRAALSAAAKSPAITEERMAELEELSLMEQAQSSLDNPSAVDAYFDAAMNAPAASRAAMNDAASAIMDPNAEQNAPDLAQSFREEKSSAKTSANTVAVGEGADFSGLDISNKRKSQLSAASAVFGKLGVQSDIDIKGDILTQTGTQVYERIKNSPAVSSALSEYFGGQWSEFSSQEKADHAARFIGEAVRKEAAGEKLNSSEKAVMNAVDNIGRGAQTVKSEQEDDINSPKNRLAGAKVDLDYAQRKANEYGNARYGGTKETRDRFEMWNDEVKRLQKEVARLEEQVRESVSEDNAKSNQRASFGKQAREMTNKLRSTGYYEELSDIAEAYGYYDDVEGYIAGLLEDEASAGVTAKSERPYDLGDIRAELRQQVEMEQYRADRVPKTPGAWQNFIKRKDAADSYYGLNASEMRELIEIYDKADAATRRDISDYLEDINYHTTRKHMIRGDYDSVMDEFGEKYTKPVAKEQREDNAVPKFMARKSEVDGNAESEYAEYDKPITSEDVEVLRSIGRKSINDFSAEDTKKSQKWAHKFWQQLGTKSPFFRAWFGDWRAYDKTSINVIDDVERVDLSDAKDAPAVLKQMKSSDDIPSGDFANNDTGFTIQVGQKVINDTLAYASRSYNRDKNFMHFLDRISALRGIDKIIENAVLLDTQVIGEDKNADRSFMHIFYTVMKYEDNAYIIRLSVDEFNSRRGDIYRAYNLKNIKITPVAVPQVYKPADTTSASGTLSSINSISDLFTLVKKYDPGFNPHEVNPVLLNKDGTPKVLYHGSPNDFNTFSLEYLGTNGTAEGYGFYFTDKRDIAEGYSHGTEAQRHQGADGKLFEVYLNIKKPLSNTEVTMTRSEFKKFLIEMNKQVDEDGEPLDFLANYGDVEWEGLDNVMNNVMSVEYDGSDSDINMIHSIINGSGSMKIVFDVLRKTTGYDGIIVEDANWGGDQTIYVAFHPDQIKSATDNIGTFDKENSDIRFAARGKAKAKVNPRTENAKNGSVELVTNIGTLNVPTVDPLIFTHGDAELTSSYRKVERMAKSFNKEPVWIAGSSVTLDGKEYGVEGGFYYKDKLYLNIENMTEGYTMLFGHELCHDMVEKDRRNNGGKSTLLSDYYNLRRAWAEKNGTTDAFEARVNDIINNRVFDDADPDAVFEEFMCDDLGTFMMNEDFARFAVAEKRSLWQKITYAVGNFVKRLKGIGARNEARELEQLHAFMLSALDNYRTDAQRNAAAAPRSVADRLSGINEPTTVAPSTLTRGIRRDARLAEQLIKDSQGRYKPREYRNISPAKWQESTSESDRALAGVTTRNAPEVDSYGYRKVSDGQSEYRVYVTNPNSPKLNKQHKDNVKAVRAFAAATGTRVGFTTGKAIMTAKEGNEYLYKYDAINDNDTVYVNIDAADPYTAIVGAHWYNQFAAVNPARARTLARLVKRMNKLTGGNATAQDVAVKQITDSEQSSNAPMSRAQMSAEALKMTSADLLATLSGDKTLARSIAREQPSLIRRALDVTGDMLSRLTGTAEERAKKLMQQTEANLLYALSSSVENNTTPEGSKISTAKKKPLPEGVRAMSQDETASIKQQLKSHLAEVNKLVPVADIKSDGRGKMNTSQQVQRVVEYITSRFGKTISRKGYGEILIGAEQIKDGIRYVNTDAEYAAFFAVPYVLKRGIEVSGHLDHKGRGYSTVTFAAPVKLNGVIGNLAVVVKQHGKNKYKMHRILMPNGKGFELKENNTEPTTYNIDTESGVEGKSIGSVYEQSVPHTADDVKFSALRKPTREENRTWLDEYSEQYGAIPEGENVNSRGNQNVPKQIDDDTRTRQTVRTYLEALSTPDAVVGEVEKDIINGRFSYTPVSNVAANQNADRILARGYDEAMAQWQGVVHGGRVADKKSIALGERLIIEAANRGDTAAATRMIAEVAAEATRAGQIVQAISMVKRLSPAGQLLSIQRQVNKLNDELARRGKEVSISEEKLKEFTDIAKRLEKAQQRISELEEMLENGQERTENGYTEDELADAKEQEQQLKEQLGNAKNDIVKDVAEQVPPSWVDKLNAWRYLAMLGNPRTHIRNLIGNAVFIPTVKLKQAMAAGLERMFVKKGDRTQSVVAPKSIREFAARDAAEQLEWLKSGGKYNATDEISEQIKSFSEKNIVGKALNKVSDFNSWALDAEDGIFLKYHYQTALAGYAAANGISAYQLENDEQLLQKARDFAAREAQRATYRDMNAFSDFMTQASRKLRAKQGMGGALAYAAFEGVVPFKKTPCNIVKRSIEYSPIGVMNSLWNGARKLLNNRKGIANDYTASEFINDLSAGMTGTMIVALGALLSSLGMLRGRNKDEEDEFEKLQGAQEYSLVIGDWSYTIDWMSPVALPLFVGAELHDQITSTNEEITLKSLLNSLVMISEPIFNLSMMDGVQSVLQSYSSEGAIVDMFTGAVESFAGQMFPTIGGQIARTIDPKTRNAYYNDKNSGVPEFLSQTVRSAMSKTPFLQSKLPERIDAWGRNSGEGQGLFERAAENFFSPGYYSKSKTTEVDKLIQQIYKETGDSSILPGNAGKSFKHNNETYYMSAEEYVTYAKTRGQTAYSIIDELRQSSAFNKLSADDKAACIDDAYTLAAAIAKSGTNSGYSMEENAAKWQREAYESGAYVEVILGRR